MDKIKTICPTCGANIDQLIEWLNEPAIWLPYPNPNAYAGFWGKSDNHLKAEDHIRKCNTCRGLIH